MQIKKIVLTNFRNYEKTEVEFSNEINVFYGKNAQGKTNLLEAIFLCSMGKSFRTNKEKELIEFKKENAKVEIHYTTSDREGKINLEIADKKSFFLNGIKIKRLSELLGSINLVLFSPDDIEILKSGPAKRRRFLDMMIGQLRPSYVYVLNQYLKTLEQRNAYLRQIKIENKPIDMLEIWEDKLITLGKKVFDYRKEYIDKLSSKIGKIHSQITENKEKIEIKYISNCQEEERYRNELIQSRQADIKKGYTSKGVHRDDFVMYINGKEVNIYGSQGQHRTAILSLKLSELNVIQDDIGESPILLLDDFMSELDQQRRKNFLKNIKETQVIITCTELLQIEKTEQKNFYVEKGEIQEKTS